MPIEYIYSTTLKTFAVTDPQASPLGATFMPSSPTPMVGDRARVGGPDGEARAPPPSAPTPPSLPPIQAFPPLDELFLKHLDDTNNRKCHNSTRRSNMQTWLKYPLAKVHGDTRDERARLAIKKHWTLKYFELQDNQIYRKAETISGVAVKARYAVCEWDMLDIIKKTHIALQHFGTFSPSFRGNN